MSVHFALYLVVVAAPAKEACHQDFVLLKYMLASFEFYLIVFFIVGFGTR
jgi:hypothetical protein